jgi:hypothetical protein
MKESTEHSSRPWRGGRVPPGKRSQSSDEDPCPTPVRQVWEMESEADQSFWNKRQTGGGGERATLALSPLPGIRGKEKKSVFLDDDDLHPGKGD